MDFSDYPITEQRNTPWKMIGVVVVGILLVIIIVAVIFRVRGSQQQQIVFDQVVNQQAASVFSECDAAEDPEACRAAKIDDVAAVTGDIEMCEGLDEEARDGCIWGVARAETDASTCTLMKDAERERACNDEISRSMALASNDASLCDNIANETAKTGCQEAFLSPLTSANCQERGKEQGYCQMLSVSEVAATKQDARLCEQVVDKAFHKDCLEFVEIDDPDFDGLSTSSEKDYGTDPDDPDTDDDGFSDGDEVEAGYDPNGPGKL